MPRVVHGANYSTEAFITSWLLRADQAHGGPAHPATNFTYAQSVREGVPPMVCIQRPGTFMFVGDDWLHGLINVGLTVSTASFTQVILVKEMPGTPEGDRYIAEYPVTGHTPRSMPDE
jgi:hypothetical protein